MTDLQGTFARLHLSGDRFEDGMPVEAAVELVAYRDLVVGVATELFFENHPERKRLPARFADRLNLKLQPFEKGSVVSALTRYPPPGTLTTVSEDEFTQARDLIERAVGHVADGNELPPDFPARAIVLFNGFGQTLRDGEAIELRCGNAASGPRYTPEVRKRLLLSRRPSYLVEVRDIGWVAEMDGERMTCSLRLRGASSTPVQAPLDELTFDRLKLAFEPNGVGPPFYLSATGVSDAQGKLVRLDSIQDVSPIPEDLATLHARLAQIEELKAGWLNGEGRSPSPAVARKAYLTLSELLRLNVPRPHLFPTEDGGVQAEWTSGDVEISITFDHDGTIFACAVDTGPGGESEDLTDGDAARLAQFVLRGANE